MCLVQMIFLEKMVGQRVKGLEKREGLKGKVSSNRTHPRLRPQETRACPRVPAPQGNDHLERENSRGERGLPGGGVKGKAKEISSRKPKGFTCDFAVWDEDRFEKSETKEKRESLHASKAAKRVSARTLLETDTTERKKKCRAAREENELISKV